MKRYKNVRLVSFIVALTFILSACGEPFLSALKPAGEVAKEQYDLMILSTIVMVAVILVVTIIFIYVIIRFRRKKGEENKIPKQVEGSHKLEIIWTVIPILLLLVLAFPTVEKTFSQADVSPMDEFNEDGKRDVLVVNVRANLYWWEFEYPDYEFMTSQDLVVPTDERVYFNLIASDVKHSFWIPAAGGKLDTNTDNVNRFYLTFDSDKANEAGNLFYGKCAELCGPSHALMDFKVQAMPREEFNQWVLDMQNREAPEPTTELAQQGEELFNQSCIGCHAITPQDIKPAEARLGPNLATFGERSRIAGFLEHNEENLKDWLKDPQALKPGNTMVGYPDYTEDELDALVEYLMELKVQE